MLKFPLLIITLSSAAVGNRRPQEMRKIGKILSLNECRCVYRKNKQNVMIDKRRRSSKSGQCVVTRAANIASEVIDIPSIVTRTVSCDCRRFFQLPVLAVNGNRFVSFGLFPFS